MCGLSFIDERIHSVLPSLQARRPQCDAMIGMVCGPAIAKLTKLGSLDMSAPDSGVAKPLNGLRGKSTGKAAGAGQLKMLRSSVCPRSSGSCPARPRICGPISCACNVGSAARTPTSRRC
jgi:hypothetical protein